MKELTKGTWVPAWGGAALCAVLLGGCSPNPPQPKVESDSRADLEAMFEASPPKQSTPPPIYSASPEELWATYLRLEHSYDASVVGMYEPDAMFYNERHYPHGVRNMEFPASKMFANIDELMTAAKAIQDRSEYRDVRYQHGPTESWIRATRYVPRKNYEGPFSLRLRKSAEGWRIAEEHLFTRP